MPFNVSLYERNDLLRIFYVLAHISYIEISIINRKFSLTVEMPKLFPLYMNSQYRCGFSTVSIVQHPLTKNAGEKNHDFLYLKYLRNSKITSQTRSLLVTVLNVRRMNQVHMVNGYWC